MRNLKRKFLIFLLLAFLLSGCTFVRIQNTSNARVTVSVRVPDSGKAYTRNIRSGNIVDVFSSHGGRYTVTMLPGEHYEALLRDLQAEFTQRLFEERETLTAEEVALLTQKLNQVDKLIEELALPMASCSGTVPDFDTAFVVVSFDANSDNYALSCSSGSE